MIGYVKGEVSSKAQNYVLIDVSGIGYKIFMTETEIEKLEIGQAVKIFTYMRVLEDDISLYGFLSNDELMMFELLLSVGGIGAKTASSILSKISPSRFALAVISGDVNALKKLPGIGPKSAGRIILELKDKIKTEDAIEGPKEEQPVYTAAVQDAIDALQVLGYNRKSIEKAFEQVDLKDMSTEEIIKKGLELL